MITTALHAAAIGRTLTRIREARGLTQESLGQKVDFSQAMISRIESGVLSPKSSALVLLCNALDVPTSIVYQRAEAIVQQAETTLQTFSPVQITRATPLGLQGLVTLISDMLWEPLP